MSCWRVPSALLLVGPLAACSVSDSAGRVDRCALGAHAAPLSGESFEQAMTTLESTIGRPLDIDRLYASLDDPVPGDYERWTSDHGRTPLVSFTGELSSGEQVSWARIADPSDAEATALVTGLADRLRDFGRPILVIFHDEAQNDAASFGTADQFIAAWRRVVEVARAEGADNAAWVWVLSSSGYPTQADDWYPGDEWVDWIGVSGFNWYTGSADSPWRTFPSIFGAFRDWAAARPKPLIVVSMASAEHPNVPPDDPKSKPTWIRETLTTVRDWPQLQALVWYDSTSDDPTKDWRVDSTPESLAAFRELASDAHFDVSAATPP